MSAAPEPWHAAFTGLLITLFGGLAYWIQTIIRKHRPNGRSTDEPQEQFRRKMEEDLGKIMSEQRRIDRRISDLHNQVDWLREQVIGANGNGR